MDANQKSTQKSEQTRWVHWVRNRSLDNWHFPESQWIWTSLIQGLLGLATKWAPKVFTRHWSSLPAGATVAGEWERAMKVFTCLWNLLPSCHHCSMSHGVFQRCHCHLSYSEKAAKVITACFTRVQHKCHRAPFAKNWGGSFNHYCTYTDSYILKFKP